MKQLYLLSLGCNKNLVDSEIMLGRLKDYAITDEPENADVIIINTCGFIESAKEESINAILELAEYKKENALLVVAGCLSQRYKDELMKEIPEVDIFTGVGDYNKIDELIAKKENRFSPNTYLLKNDERVITGSSYHAYIKLSEGCNQKCSFCAIPTFKGRLQSRSLEDIVNEVKSLVSKGYTDFSFISQDSSSYARDFGKKDGLIELIDEIDKIDGVKFARILYLYPTTTSNELVEKIISSTKFVNYFDMPIQHISDNQLKIMRRGAGKERILELLNLMGSAKNSFLRTGFIVGHPGESDADFEELCEFLKEFEFDRVSVFAYSKEENTKAYEMEQVPDSIIQKRLEKIEKITAKLTKNSFKKEIGKTVLCQINSQSSEGEFFFGAKNVIWDREIDGEILINDSEIKDLEVGKVYKCLITTYAGDKLVGEIIA
ncbi:MAG: 30S ribosomal protein S12 methylthiotransferase RimO [Campylobacteraceae bacterium]|nr:30S ribosomal protein S12 methylthiotransferase RimO [Campylobacteraceae bacterium]